MAIDLSQPNTIILTESQVRDLPGFEILDGERYTDSGDRFYSIGFHDPAVIEYWPTVDLPPEWHCLGFIAHYGEYFAHIKPKRQPN